MGNKGRRAEFSVMAFCDSVDTFKFSDTPQFVAVKGNKCNKSRQIYLIQNLQCDQNKPRLCTFKETSRDLQLEFQLSVEHWFISNKYID